MKRTTKKLQLNKQSVRVLRQDELSLANGGTIYTGPIILITARCAPTTLTAYQTGCESTYSKTTCW